MRVVVFGVTNWDDKSQAEKQTTQLRKWEERVRAFIPNVTEVFLTCGSYSPPEFNPTDLPIHQVPMYRGAPYSVQNNYFHLGLKTGLWKKCIDDDYDLLIHCQTTRFISSAVTDALNKFMDMPELVMAPRFSSMIGTSIDVGFLAMKPKAVLYYCAAGHRYSLHQTNKCLNCEEEAYLLFNETWFEPFPQCITTKQLDISAEYDDPYNSPFTIKRLKDFIQYPIIATGKHVEPHYLQEWEKYNACS